MHYSGAMAHGKRNVTQNMKDLSLSLTLGHKARVDTILAHCTVQEVDDSGVLVKAVLSNDPDATTVLLNTGADPNATLPNMLYTPLMAAVRKNHAKHDQIGTVELLLNSGADPYIKDEKGRDILDMAQETYDEQKNEGSQRMVDYLKTVMPEKIRSYKAEHRTRKQNGLRRYVRRKRPGA